MFLSGGPGRVLSEILSRGGDLRALLTIKDHVPPEIAIAKAVETGDKKMLDTTIAIWGTNVGDGGLRLAMKMGMSHGIDAVISTVVGTVRHRNAYYVSKRTRKLPGDAVVEISSMGLGSTSGLLAEGLTKEQIMRTRHWPGGKLRDFFSYGFTREIPTYIIVPMVGTIIKEGMEEDLLEYLERHPYALDDDHVSGLISSLGYEKALRGRWGKILSRPLSRKAYDITVQLANMDLVEAGVHIIEMGYDMTPEEDFYRQLPCAYVMRLEGMEVNAMIPYTIEEVLWMCTMAGNYHDVVRIDGSSGVGVEDGRLYIPTVVDVNPGDASVDEWMTNVDVCLCAMSYPGF
ncbi:hypothetical protein BGZ83_002714 [Gryganskiella cystojenkinii]|nr:hypothetical protein BGZ83_002714 [Gryganskiella cystojenkinii]